LAEKEENLLTIFKQMSTDISKIRENMDNLATKLDTTISDLITLNANILYDYYVELQELKKLFQWYAEKQTGRKYTKET